MKKLQEIVTNPIQNNPFLSRPTGSSRRHDRDRNERNVARRLEQALEVVCRNFQGRNLRNFFFPKERLKYKKLQNEKDEELATLSDDINKLKRDLETRRDEIEKYKRILETRGSVDNISLTSDDIDDDRGEIFLNRIFFNKFFRHRSFGKLGTNSHTKYSTRWLETTIRCHCKK